MKEKISIIIPIYNMERYLDKCLNSIIDQTIKDIEIICINDNSTDKSLSIIKNYKDKDNRVKYINFDINKGVALARNEGLKIAKGEYYICLDPDDWYPNNDTLEKMYNNAKKNNVLAVAGSINVYDINENLLTDTNDDLVFKNNGIILFKDWQKSYYHCRFLLHTETMQKNGLYYPNYRRFQDPPYLMKYLFLVKKFYAMTDIVYCYRKIIKSNNFSLEDTIDIIDGLIDLLKFSLINNLDILAKDTVNKANSLYFTNVFKMYETDHIVMKKLLEIVSIYEKLSYNTSSYLKRYSSIISVSIIIPIYNVEKYISECIESIINQSLQNIEIICVDDCGNDNSMNIIENYSNKDMRIKIIKHEYNKGLGEARNSGLKIARGKYIWFIDSDDYIFTNTACEELYNLAIENDADLVRFSAFKINDNNPDKKESFSRYDQLKADAFYYYKDDIKYFVDRNPRLYCAPFYFFKREFLQKEKLYFSAIIHEDEILGFWVLFCNRIYLSTKSYYVYRVHENSIMTKRIININYFNEITKLYDLFIDFCDNYKLNNANEYLIFQILKFFFFNTQLKYLWSKDVNLRSVIANIFLKYFKKISNLYNKNNYIAWINDSHKEFLNNINNCENASDLINEINKIFLNDIPKISIIVPVYNDADYLHKCLNSIIGQTMENIEIICINDGSIDNSLDILKEYEKVDNRIILINQENNGAAAARNLGIKTASGKYLGFVDGDDFIDDNYFSILYNEANKNEADLARISYKYYYNENEQYEDNFNRLLERKIKNRQLLNVNEHTVVIWNAIYKKDYIINNEIYFNKDCLYAEDVLWTAKSTFYSKKSIPVIGSFYYYRKNKLHVYNINLSEKFLNNTNYFIMANNETIKFINSVNYKNKNDYIIAYKRCLWRFDDKMRNLIDKLDNNQLQLIFNEFIKAFENFKYKNMIKKESYYNYLLNNNFSLYLKSIEKPKVIVSLTSYPPRIKIVHIAIESLINQNYKADKIVLWLAKSEFPNGLKNLPNELLNLTNKGLEIEWLNNNIKSYKKLIPALEKYKNEIIVTADDDIIYKQDWLESLLNTYNKNPNVINAARCHKILFDKKGNIKPYKEWKKHKTYNVYGASYFIFPTSGAGVVWKSGYFHNDVFNEEKFMKIAPLGDDIWFWAMSVLKGTKINYLKNMNFDINTIEESQDVSLWFENFYGGKNDQQLNEIIMQYPEILKKLNKEIKENNMIMRKKFIKNIIKIFIPYGFIYIYRRIKRIEKENISLKFFIKIFLPYSIIWFIRNNKNKGFFLKRLLKKVLGHNKLDLIIQQNISIKKEIEILKDNYNKNFNIIIDNISKTNMNINDKFKIFIMEKERLNNLLLENKNIGSEILWANIFNNSIQDSYWLNNKTFSPGRWAAGYAFLYILYRIIKETQPIKILELGLGETTRMISQYAMNKENVEHYVVENDTDWINFYRKSVNIPHNTKIIQLPLKYQAFEESETVRVYEGFYENFSNNKYDLISIDGPVGGDMKDFSRIDSLSLIPENLSNDFIILVDDYNRNSEKNMVKKLLEKIDEANIPYYNTVYKGAKETCIICCQKYKFLTSL